MIVVQLSDTHFGTEQPEVIEALVSWLTEQAPDLVIFSGDITQRARRRQFAAAREFIDRIPKHELLTVPGNHDLPLFDLVRRAWNPYGYYREFFGDNLEPSFESERLAVICLNTTHPGRHKDGVVTEEQIVRVERQLHAVSPDKVKLLVAHHPFDVVLTRDEENLMHNGEAAIRRWAAAGLDLVMGGHIHFPFTASLLGRYPDLPRDVWCLQAGTATSRRVRHSKPNSFNRVVIGEKLSGVSIERWDYGAEDGQFQRVACFQPWSSQKRGCA